MPPMRDDVLLWYNSLGETLSSMGMDIHNKADLARIKYVVKDTDPFSAGDFINCGKDIQFAFMRRVPNANGELEGLAKPAPAHDQVSQESYDTVLMANAREEGQVKMLRQLLLDKMESLAPEDELEEIRTKIAAAQTTSKTHNDEFRKYGIEYFRDYSNWLLSNPEVFDPSKEDDYKHIEQLYMAAKEGLLYVEPLELGDLGVTQLLVDNLGFATKGKKDSELTTEEMRGFTDAATIIDGIKRGVITDPDTLEIYRGLEGPKRFRMTEPKRPKEVAKPGAFSWFKRIISFGLANGDFRDYDNYQKRYEKYVVDKAAYDTEKENVFRHNKELFETLDNRLKAKYEDVVPGVENPARIVSAITVIKQAIDQIPAGDGTDGIWEGRYMVGRRLRTRELLSEIQKNPKSLNPDGTINVIESVRYQSEHEFVPQEAVEYEQKYQRKLKDAELKYQKGMTIKKGAQAEINEHAEKLEFAKAEKTIAEGTEKVAKKEEEMDRGAKAESKGHKWLDVGVDELMTKIGALYGEDKAYGERVFYGLCMRNNPEFADGTMKPDEMTATDAEVMKDVNALVRIALSSKKPAKDVYDRFLFPMEQMVLKEKDFSPERIYDSLASVVATTQEYEGNLAEAKSGTVFCAIIADKIAKSHPDMDMSKLSLSGEGEREFTAQFASEANEVRAEFAKKYRENPELMAEKAKLETAKKVVEKKDVPEIDETSIHRPFEPGL